MSGQAQQTFGDGQRFGYVRVTERCTILALPSLVSEISRKVISCEEWVESFP
jgi:hypothetical protein